MSSSLRRGALAATALAFSIVTLSACAAGNNSQTLQVKPDNAATTVGTVKIQNAVVITQPDTKSTGPAAIAATVFNTGTKAQTLTGITVDGTDKSAVLTPAKGDTTGSTKGNLVVPAGGSVVIGGAGNASAVLNDPGTAVVNGNAQKITFTFTETGDVSLQAFVVPATGYFASWGPSDVPTPSSSPSSASSSETSPSESPSASESAATGH